MEIVKHGPELLDTPAIQRGVLWPLYLHLGRLVISSNHRAHWKWLYGISQAELEKAMQHLF